MIEFHKLVSSALGTAKRVLLAKTRGDTADEDDNAASDPYDNAEVLFPVGFVARPTSGSATAEAVIVRDGDEIHVLFFLDKGGEVHDCAAGEAQVYSPKEPTCRIRFGADGVLKLNSKSGQDMVLNDGTAKVARVGDAASAASTMTTWLAAVTDYINGIAPGTVVLPTNFGTITGPGASNVKA